MDVIDVESRSELQKFASALEKAHFRTYEDEFTVIEQFGSISSSRAIEIAQSTKVDEEKFANSELETRLWTLVDLLYRLKSSAPGKLPPLHSYSSNAIVQERHLHNNPKLRENWLILGWLQDSLPSPEEPKELRGIKWMYTKNKVKQQNLGSINRGLLNTGNNRLNNIVTKSDQSLVSELDPDAPLRSKKSISSEDEAFDRVIFKYIFELLRARKYEEALDICEKTGNWALKVAISGHNEYIDPDIDGDILGIDDVEPRGAENKALWQYTCRQLAQQAHNIDPYERGIYGLLGGDLESVLSLCDSWETQFVAYMSHLMTCDADSALVDSKRLSPDIAISANSIKSNSSNSAQKVLDVLSNSSNPVVHYESENMIRSMMGAVINDVVGYLVEQTAISLQQFMAGVEESSPFTKSPHILRILVHLVLFLQSINIPVGEKESISVIIYCYIELLTAKDCGDLVPLYIGYLPDDIAIDTYSVLLADITDQTKRKEHLQLGRKYGLDMANSIRAAVARVFSITESYYIPEDTTEVSEVVSDYDIKLCQSIEWYIDSNMWPDAVHSIAALYKRFLSAGRVGAAREFGNRIRASYVVKRYDGAVIGSSTSSSLSTTTSTIQLSGSERLEVLEYERLVQCLNDIFRWDNHLKLADQSTKPWRTEALSIVDSISSQVYNLCSNWLQQEKIEQSPYIDRLRTIYLPFIVLELARVLISAQEVHSGFLKQATELAILVADEKQGLYQLFLAGGQLNQFLSSISTAVTEGVVHGESGIFDE